MALQAGKSAGLALGRGGTQGFAKEKSKSYEDLGLLLALILLLGWALFVGLRAVDWPALSHTLRALVAFIG
ncbi:MAG TPA: hypothetical protein VGW37_07265 [Terriglobia bacterium]|nr:hypothetical protein [Terriglobia bacterium]